VPRQISFFNLALKEKNFERQADQMEVQVKSVFGPTISTRNVVDVHDGLRKI